ncbi:MAG: 2-isopropylmalate synthase [Deltaproteobacteria bacterium]|nr:2-isopropylmalate synthase [Deltaproteobacteria bacterium]
MSQNEIVKIFDTTLRDGEQSPGCSMDIQEKIRMARQLAKLGVDVIEAGFPIASEGDFLAVKTIAQEIEGPAIAGLSRANFKDIDRTFEAVKFSKKPRIHTFIATSDIHLEYKLKKSREQVLEEVYQAVKHAAQYTPDVEFSAEDATRSDKNYLAQVFSAAVEAGATTLNVPDTVGYTYPEEFFKLIHFLKANVKMKEGVVFSVHCHNDLGLAVANSLAAVQAGARQVECTINGIGERAGNCSLEEVVMAMRVRKDLFQTDTHIISDQLHHSSRLLTLITGVSVQPNKAIVGANAFAHESGIHQDGILKNKMTYEIMTPESVGWTAHKLVLGKHSGRHAFRSRLIELGYDLSEEQLVRVFDAFKALADIKKEIFDDDIEALVTDEITRGQHRYEIIDVEVESGTHTQPQAKITLKNNDQIETAESTGAGPVDATFKAIRQAAGFTGELLKFNVAAITGGTDAQGEVSVTLKENKKEVRGVGTHADIILASAKAYVNALNRLEHFRKRQEGI